MFSRGGFLDKPLIELVSKYYPKHTILPYILPEGILRCNTINTTDPIFSLKMNNVLDGIGADYKINLDTQFNISGVLINYPEILPDVLIDNLLTNGLMKLTFQLKNTTHSYIHSTVLFINFGEYFGSYDKYLSPLKGLKCHLKAV